MAWRQPHGSREQRERVSGPANIESDGTGEVQYTGMRRRPLKKLPAEFFCTRQVSARIAVRCLSEYHFDSALFDVAGNLVG
jgi:hypothetical protein